MIMVVMKVMVVIRAAKPRLRTHSWWTPFGVGRTFARDLLASEEVSGSVTHVTRMHV